MVGNVVEWFNPPLLYGVEYRLTERYNNKPVYIKAVNIGALPNTAYMSVDLGVPQKVFRPFDLGGCAVSPDGTYSYLLSSIGNHFESNDIHLNIIGQNLWINAKGDYSSFSATAWVKYTKSTD